MQIFDHLTHKIRDHFNYIKLSYIDPVSPDTLVTVSDFYNYKEQVKEFLFKGQQKRKEDEHKKTLLLSSSQGK